MCFCFNFVGLNIDKMIVRTGLSKKRFFTFLFHQQISRSNPVEARGLVMTFDKKSYRTLLFLTDNYGPREVSMIRSFSLSEFFVK